MSVQRCKREHTSREFVRWKVWLRNKTESKEKLDYLIASVVQAIRQTRVKNPGSIKLEDCLVDIKLCSAQEEQGQKITKKQAASWAKTRWLTPMGISWVDK